MKRYLVLENGKVFEGEGFGADKPVMAEIVFTTAMTGFFETLTDPSYHGQAVVHTFPLIGNYGIIPEDAESNRVGPSAYIVREWCEKPSNFRCSGDLDAFLRKNEITGLSGIDTRALTRMLREAGTMNGMITDDPDSVDIEEVKKYRVDKPVYQVSMQGNSPEEVDSPILNIALIDYGKKDNIDRELTARGCNVKVFPHNANPDDILAFKPDGIFLSNGPGDPKDNVEGVKTLQELIPHKIPTMGICMGHQIFAIANGCSTRKMKYGNRGANQAVKNTIDGRVYITSQNHGYEVDATSIDEDKAVELYVNVNDGSNEGILYKEMPAFTVQFHPEACGGPRDTKFLFDEYIKMVEENKNA